MPTVPDWVIMAIRPGDRALQPLLHLEEGVHP